MAKKPRISEAAESQVGKSIKVHGGKIPATVYKAFSSTAVLIDYDGLFEPEDKRTRVTGRKLVTLDELAKPEMISVGQFKRMASSY